MKAYVAKVIHTLRNEGVLSVVNRSVRYGMYRARRSRMNTSECVADWEALRGRYAGRRAFLIGNGPSLNLTELYLLKNEATMCFNRFDLIADRLEWAPTFYMVIDDRVLLDTLSEVEALSAASRHAFFPDIHPYNIDFRGRIRKAPHVHWLYLDRPDFSEELPYCGINKTVANVGLQVLAFLGFTDIYLLGVDMSYTLPASVKVDGKRDATATEDDDESHFDPRYFGVGRKFHVPMLDETFLKFREARVFFEERGVSVRNATVGGVLEEFERTTLDDVLQLTPEAKAERFRRLVRERVLEPDFDPLAALASSPEVATADEVDPMWAVFRAGADRVADLVRGRITEYLPLGPFDGQHLYVRRDLVRSGLGSTSGIQGE